MSPTTLRVHPRRHQTPRGLSTIGVLFASVLGAIVIGGFMVFWLNGAKFHSSASDHTKQETMGLQVLNRIAKDVSESSGVALADERQLVLVQQQGDGTTNWVRYAVTADNNLYKQTRVNAPATFDPANPGFGPEPTRGFIVEDVAPAADGSSLFTFTTTDGTELDPAVDLPAFNPGLAARVALVDIAFAADTKSMSGTGSVELHTAVEVQSGSGGQVDPIRPACPKVRFVQGDPYPIMQWSMTGYTTQFRIVRTGTGGSAGLNSPVTFPLISADTSQELYDFVDTDPAGTTVGGTGAPADQPINYLITAIGVAADGTELESTGCEITTWYPRLATPDVTATLYPPTPEPTDYPAGWTSATPSEVRLSWPQVVGAHYYEVYRRTLQTTDKYAGDYQPIDGFTLVETISVNPKAAGYATATVTPPAPYSIGLDTAYAYRVVAWGPMPESSPREEGIKVLGHTQPMGTTTAVVEDRNINNITWTGDPGPTATEQALWRRDLSTCYPTRSSWRLVQRFPGEDGLEVREWTDTDAIAGTRYEYAVAAYNYGPRGTLNSGAPTRYSSVFNSTGTALQYPANPTTSATGSSGGPYPTPVSSKYTNRVSITPGCATTTDSYDLSIYRGLSAGPVEVIPGVTGSYTDTDVPRATRKWYRAVAQNETGYSANIDTGTTGAAPAYQWPNKPPAPSISGGNPSNSTYYDYVTVPLNSSPSSAYGSCSYYQRNYRWDYVWVSSHGGSGHYSSPGGWSSTSPTTAHGHYVQNPDSDTFQCIRYNSGVTFTWPGTVVQHNGDATGGETGFCGTSGASCTWTVQYTYSSPYGGGQDTCSVSYGSNSCSRTWYSGNITNPTYTVTSMKLIATNPGGSSISDEPNETMPAPAVTVPRDPAFTVRGSYSRPDGTGARDDGRNTIHWAPAKDATGYRVYAYQTYSGNNVTDSSPRLVYQGTGASAAGAMGAYTFSVYDTHTSVRSGTETYYRVVAYNAQGTSPGTTVKKAAYQRPAAFTLTQVGSWDPTADAPSVTFSWTQTADSGMPVGAKFCTAGRGACSQTLWVWNRNTNKFVDSIAVPRTATSATVNVPLGMDSAFALAVCNTGGCRVSALNNGSPAFSTAPGEFLMVTHGGTLENRGIKWSGHVNIAEPDFPGKLAPKWSKSEGAEYYRVGRLEADGSDPRDLDRPNGYAGTAATAAATVGTTGGESRQAPAWNSTPSAMYDYDIFAVGYNGKSKKITFRLLAQPPKLQMSQAAVFCKRGSNDDGDWKMGYEFRTRGKSYDENIQFDRVKTLAWAGRLTAAEWGSPQQAGMTLDRARALAGIDVDKNAGEGTEIKGTQESGVFPGDSTTLGNWDAHTNWRATDWDTANAPGFSQPGSTGLWKSNLPGSNRGVLADGTVFRDEFGGQDDRKTLPSHASRTSGSLEHFTWLDRGATRYSSVDVGRFVTVNNSMVFPRGDSLPASADAHCSTGSTWHANDWSTAVGRWSTTYTGYRSGYGASPQNVRYGALTE